MTQDEEFEKYTGNYRIKSIAFDALAQMWEGCGDEYDPKVEEPLAKFYIGKIGKYVSDSYVKNDYLRCASIMIVFTNGHTVMVMEDDVEATREEETWVEFLPKIEEPVKEKLNYVPLSDEQKAFADKVFLQLVAGQQELHDEPLRVLLNQSVCLALYRTEMYSRHWDISWIDKLGNK